MIKVTSLYKTFGAVTAADHLDLHIPARVICGLVGPDGAGKTTLMRMLCGLLAPNSGEILIMGTNLKQLGKSDFTLGYMPQRFSLYGDLTIMENIHFLGSLYGLNYLTRVQRAEEILALTGLISFKSRLAANLSGGMKQKLALTCALITRPELLILDEPTYGVDPESRKEFWKILYTLNKNGMTILVSTPYMDEAELCHQVLFINQGRITASGSPLQLRQQFAHQVLKIQADSHDPYLLNGIPGILDASFYGSCYRLVTDDAEYAGRAVREHCQHRGIKNILIIPVNPSMEDVFVFMAEAEVSAWNTP
jgi:ABC-2 type transport system ATP-binding protein